MALCGHDSVTDLAVNDEITGRPGGSGFPETFRALVCQKSVGELTDNNEPDSSGLFGVGGVESRVDLDAAFVGCRVRHFGAADDERVQTSHPLHARR